VRLAILISFAAFGLTFSAARADGPLLRVALGVRSGYIVPRDYAEDHQADLIAGIPGLERISGFWTPTEVDVIVAERVFQDLIRSAAKDPKLLFPDLAPNPDPTVPADLVAAAQLENERYELTLVSGNYGRYSRQYVGIIIDGQKLVFCNYSEGTKVDPATDYIFIQKVFVPDGTVHFLQCRFDPVAKTCLNVSMIGSWQKEKANF
jgi:hypothetical protein